MKQASQKMPEADRLVYLGGDDVVFFSPQQDYRTYVLSMIDRYDKRSKILKIIHHTLQLVIFVDAAVVPALIVLPGVPKAVPVVLSTIVAAASALVNYYKFGEHGRDLRLCAEDMALEYNRFETNREPYKNLDAEKAQELFMNRIEDLFRDQRQRVLALEKLQQAEKK